MLPVKLHKLNTFKWSCRSDSASLEYYITRIKSVLSVKKTCKMFQFLQITSYEKPIWVCNKLCCKPCSVYDKWTHCVLAISILLKCLLYKCGTTRITKRSLQIQGNCQRISCFSFYFFPELDNIWGLAFHGYFNQLGIGWTSIADLHMQNEDLPKTRQQNNI